MELKLTTKRALEYEERTGKDLFKFLQEVAKTEEVTIKDIVELFIAMGDNYTVEVFDAWDIPFKEKVVAVMTAAKEYVQGKKA